ncbi:MAG: NAD(P)/FAD-dependent oxidoreductase, partial [Deltaproteobacteria bacterium]|nr:NAD(P)/FAD-dependent oxidoreductase [Nannocystaceae bacterium]
MTHDVIVVGGSFAGISAALQLARARRNIVVVDAGMRRNRFAATSHGFLGQDGRPPEQIIAAGRAELLAYPTVTWCEGLAVEAAAVADGFAVTLASGERLVGKRLVLALGVVDDLPTLPGVAERWGKTVFHCPYCHGYELGGGPIAVLATMPMSVHHAMLLPDWGPTTYFTQGLFEPDREARSELERRGTAINTEPVTAIAGDTGVEVHLRDGRVLAFAGLFLASRIRVSTPLAAQLGCELEDSPMGSYLRTDMTRETTVRGVFACGDISVGAGAVALA